MGLCNTIEMASQYQGNTAFQIFYYAEVKGFIVF